MISGLAGVPSGETPTITELRKGVNHEGEFLVTLWSDGSATVAFRGASWETWGRPVSLMKVPTK